MIIAATNTPFDLDDAALRWFTKWVYVGMPDFDCRKAIIENLLKEEKVDISSSRMTQIVTDLEGYSCSDITALTKEAAMGPLLDYDPKDL